MQDKEIRSDYSCSWQHGVLSQVFALLLRQNYFSFFRLTIANFSAVFYLLGIIKFLLDEH